MLVIVRFARLGRVAKSREVHFHSKERFEDTNLRT